MKPTQNRKKRIQKKKDGVEMAMKYRNYRDPLYYDPKANDKIFVPVQYEVSIYIPLLKNYITGGHD